jgi:hypothetical protein
MWCQTQSSEQISVRFLVQSLVFHDLLPLVHEVFRSHKDHRQVCMLLHVNCYIVGTLIISYVLNYLFTICAKIIIFIVLKV